MDKKQTAMTELRDKMRMKQMTIDQFDSLFEQAIAKERQQIEEAYNKGYADAELEWTGSTQEDVSQYSDAKNYFNQTYQ
jgi:predicted secreted protein